MSCRTSACPWAQSGAWGLLVFTSAGLCEKELVTQLVRRRPAEPVAAGSCPVKYPAVCGIGPVLGLLTSKQLPPVRHRHTASGKS